MRGEVLRVDRFGNLITNIDRRSFDRVGRPGEAAIEIRAGAHLVGRLVSTYAEIAPGEVCSLFGSTDHLESRRQQRQRGRDARAWRGGAAVIVTRTS